MQNRNGRGFKYEYKLVEWSGLDEWEETLNRYTNEGWQVEAHKLEGGWRGATMFRKVEAVRVPLIEASIDTQHIYSVINSTAMYDLTHNSEAAQMVCRLICDKIKQVCGNDSAT